MTPESERLDLRAVEALLDFGSVSYTRPVEVPQHLFVLWLGHTQALRAALLEARWDSGFGPTPCWCGAAAQPLCTACGHRRDTCDHAANFHWRAVAPAGAGDFPPASFGHINDPAWTRGEIQTVTPGERYVEMACCGFRYSADHQNADGGYSCPLCEPDDETGLELSEKAMRHVEVGCSLPPGHAGPCAPAAYGEP